MLSMKAFWTTDFVFFLPQIPRILFHGENLQALESFTNFTTEAFQNFLNLFSKKFEFTVQPSSFELELRYSTSLPKNHHM